MRHPDEEELIDLYYAGNSEMDLAAREHPTARQNLAAREHPTARQDLAAREHPTARQDLAAREHPTARQDLAAREHLDTCAECRQRFAELKRSLDAWDDYTAPPRAEGYGSEVWKRVAPKLPGARAQRAWWPRKPQWTKKVAWTPWVLGPALATLLLAAFFAGRYTREPAGRMDQQIAGRTQDRVLLMAVSEHLERSQILLTELSHATATDETVFDTEREHARQLVEDNRLLRQSAWRSGDRSDAVLLDDLERVLLDVANASPNAAGSEGAEQALRTIQDRIGQNSLLFRVRVTALDAKRKGQKL